MHQRSITSFSSDRSNYKASLLEWIDLVDQWVESPDLEPLMRHFEKHYGLSQPAVKQHLKRTISNWYDFAECRFLRPITSKSRVKPVLWFLGAFGFLVSKSKSISKPAVTGKLLIDDIENADYELGAFSKLIENADFKIYFATISEKEAARRPDLYLFADKQNYSRKLVFNALGIELRHGIKLYDRLSKKLNVDIFRLAFSILNKYLYYESLFDQIKVEYCLSWRDYGAFSIKKDVFKRKGGKAVCAVQRSAHKYIALATFIDLDIYFSLGEWFGDFLTVLKGKINRVVPIGSLLCNRYLRVRPSPVKKKYDIIWADNAIIKSSNFYNEYRQDHFTAYQWLALFAGEYNNVNIAIKPRESSATHRFSAEAELLLKPFSNVFILESSVDLYSIARESRIVTTFYSTVGYELMGAGIPAVFCDPDKRRVFVPDSEDFNQFSVSSYEEFRNRILYLLSANENEIDAYTNRFNRYCENSGLAVEEMLNVFCEQETVDVKGLLHSIAK